MFTIQYLEANIWQITGMKRLIKSILDVISAIKWNGKLMLSEESMFER